MPTARPKLTHPGPQLAALREAKGWTVYRLAKESGVGPQVIARIESQERSLKWDTACRFADALGVPVDRLR